MLIVSAVLILLASLSACSDRSEQDTLPVPSPEPSAVSESISPESVAPLTAEPFATPEGAQEPSHQPDSQSEPGTPMPVSGEVVISFNFERQSGSASNQFAVWIEDTSGNMIKTLYATGYTANGGYRDRPDSIALWVERSGLASMSADEVDAISGATPGTGQLSYTWDLTDMDGETVLPGEYQFFVEGTLRWKNFVLFPEVVELGTAPLTVQAVAEYTYEASSRYGALTSDSPENNMITSVAVAFIPD